MTYNVFGGMLNLAHLHREWLLIDSYALKRHLLKFEAIYPANAPVFGSVRGEPIYSRENVHRVSDDDDDDDDDCHYSITQPVKFYVTLWSLESCRIVQYWIS